MRIGGKQAIGENLLYVMVWTAIFLVPVLNSKMMSELTLSVENIFIAWRKIAPYFLIFLVNNAILAPRLMFKRRYLRYLFIDLLLIMAVFYSVEYYDSIYLANQLAEVDNELRGKMFTHHSYSILSVYWNVMLGFFMTGANIGIKMIYKSMQDEQKMEALRNENLQAEMDYLKYQINPHFFMNTLNNIHALVDINAETAKSSIIELSKMMRYVLYESGNSEISLHSDITFISNYIELMRIRYVNHIDVKINYPEELSPKIAIPPLLLIVFVENAFKHGMNQQKASFIHIDVDVVDEMVCCKIVNSRWAGRKGGAKSAGIGLQNVSKRLKLLYAGRNYSLDIDDYSDPSKYSVTLKIPQING